MVLKLGKAAYAYLQGLDYDKMVSDFQQLVTIT